MARREHIDKRRSIVASLLARGLRQSEILDTLSQDKYASQEVVQGGILIPNPHFVGNPKTGDPVNKATISRDVKHLREQWQEEARVNTDEVYAAQLAELRELRRSAWAARDITEVRQCLALEIKLTGTAKPERLEHRLDDDQFEKMVDARDDLMGKLEMMAVKVQAN